MIECKRKKKKKGNTRAGEQAGGGNALRAFLAVGDESLGRTLFLIIFYPVTLYTSPKE